MSVKHVVSPLDYGNISVWCCKSSLIDQASDFYRFICSTVCRQQRTHLLEVHQDDGQELLCALLFAEFLLLGIRAELCNANLRVARLYFPVLDRIVRHCAQRICANRHLDGVLQRLHTPTGNYTSLKFRV